MSKSLTQHSTSLVLMSKQNGVTLIPAKTPLTRLNYFDGKFLRAADLQAEQNYLRSLVHLSNQADGSQGVAYGFDVSLAPSDTLNVGAGLAVDPQGRVLLLPQETNVSVAELIELSKKTGAKTGGAVKQQPGGFADCLIDKAEPPITTLPGSELYLIVISHTEALCGQEDVYGKLCEEACATDTDRPYRVEGLVIRAVPLQLRTPLATSSAVQLTRAHQRSMVASAYFNDEREVIASFISKAGLTSEMWCFGAEQGVGSGVPIGVLARAGTSTIFLDAWTARRERIDTQAKRYWQWRMAMRPWDVFLAQILQFQCQLHDLYKNEPEGDGDPCRDERQLISEAADAVARLSRYYEEVTGRLMQMNASLRSRFQQENPTLTSGLTQIDDLHRRLLVARLPPGPLNRILIRGGIVELPSAGYLPVTPGEAVTINRQVRRLMGEGVDLRFCVVRPDYVAHALEQAQHMERISLLEGLDHPDRKPQVDILVPNGQVLEEKKALSRNVFEATLSLSSVSLNTRQINANAQPGATNAAGASGPSGAGSNPFVGASGSGVLTKPTVFQGAARTELLPTGGGAFHLATLNRKPDDDTNTANTAATNQPHFIINADTAAGGQNISGALARGSTRKIGIWMSMSCEKDIFTLQQNESSRVELQFVEALPDGSLPLVAEGRLQGNFFIEQAAMTVGNERRLTGRLSVLALLRTVAGDKGQERNGAFDLKVTVTLGQSASGTAVKLRVDDPKKNLSGTFEATWGSEPLQLKAHFDYGDPTKLSRLLGVDLLSNPEVYEPNNDAHVMALSALNLIGVGLKDMTFVERASRLLFPPPPPPSEELIVRGTLDWVLFHRRRTARCSPDVPPPVAVATRRYALFHLKIRDGNELPFIREALQNSTNDVIERLGFQQVAIVEFGAGVTALVSDPNKIETDWQAVDPGNMLGYGAIASRGAAADEGEALAEGRLNRMEQAVSTISPTFPESVIEVLRNVPDPLSVQGTDGMIVLITGDEEVKTVCHSVYRASTIESLRAAVELIKQGQIKVGLDRNKIELLGQVTFKEKSSEVLNDSLQPVIDKWNTKGGGVPADTAFTWRKDALGDAMTMLIEQVKTIHKAIGPGSIPVESIETTAEMPTDCPVFSIIAVKEVKTVCHSVYRARSLQSYNSALIKIQRGDIQDAIIRDRIELLGDIFFKEDSDEITGDSAQPIVDQWVARGGGNPVAVAVVSPVGTTAADIALRKNQSNKIKEAIGSSDATPDNIPTPGILPTGCPVFSLIAADIQQAPPGLIQPQATGAKPAPTTTSTAKTEESSAAAGGSTEPTEQTDKPRGARKKSRG